MDVKPDPIEQYHSENYRLLNKKYKALNTSVLLDKEAKEKEDEKSKAELQKMSQMKVDVFAYNYQLWLVACLIAVNDFEDAELVIGSIWGDE